MATVLNVTEILKRSDGTEIKISGDSKFYAQNNYANLILLDIEDGGSLEACALINFTQQTRQSFTSHNFFMKPVGIVTRVVNEEFITAYQYAIQVPKLVLQNNTKNVIETELTATISSGSNYKGYFSTLVSLNTSIPPTETLKNDLSIAYVVELEKFMQVDYNSLTTVYEWVEVDYVNMFLTQKQYSLSSIYIQPGYSSPQGIAPISVSNTQVIMNILNDLEVFYNSLNADFNSHKNNRNNPHEVKAVQVPFNNIGTQLVATNTESAIKEVNANERNTNSVVNSILDGTATLMEIRIGVEPNVAILRYIHTNGNNYQVVQIQYPDGRLEEINETIPVNFRNETGLTLNSGRLLMSDGTTQGGNPPRGLLFDPTSPNAYKLLGVTTIDGTAPNAKSKVTKLGIVHDVLIADLFVSGTTYEEGQFLWGVANGRLSNKAPNKPALQVIVGMIINLTGTKVDILINPIIFEKLADQSDVQIGITESGTMLGNGNILRYQTSTQTWVNSNTLTVVESEINNIKNGTTIVKKAEQDASGNVITSTYETKADATNKLLTKVDKTQKIIGIDLQDDILLTEFKTALGNATQSVAGLLSAEDKTHLDGLVALLESSDGNNVVDTIGEILEIFQNYPEGADLVTVLNGKVDKVAGKELSQNDFTDALKNKLDGLLNGNQYYDKIYIDALKDQNGWKSQLLTLTPLAPSGTIATATLLLYNTLKLQVKNTTTSFVDTDSVEVSLGVITGNKIQLSDTSVYLEIGTTDSTFVAPTGWELQIVGLKYTELKAIDTTYDGTGTNYLGDKDNTQTAINELDTQVKASNDAIALRELLSNKATDFTVVDDTKYPTTKAVQGAIDEVEARVDTLETFKDTTVPATYETKVDVTSKLAQKADVAVVNEINREQDYRIATIEEAYRKSQNGELTTTKSGTDIISLGKDVAPAPLQVKVDGGLIPALENLITNGDSFSSGFTLFNATGSVVGGVYQFTATAQYGRLSQSIPQTQGNVYLAIARVKTPNSKVRLELWESAGVDTQLQITTTGQYTIVKSVRLTTSTVTNLRVGIVDWSTSAWTPIEVDYVMAFNLTDLFGVTTTSGTAYDNAVADIETMLALNGGYISSTPIHAVGMNKRVRSVGKNLFDVSAGILSNQRSRLVDGLIDASSTYSLSKPIIIQPNTSYYVNGNYSTSYGNAVYDQNMNFIQGYNNATFTTPNNARYLIVQFNIGRENEIQLEQGTVETTYVPYANTDLYLQANKVGYKLPNGVADTIEYRNGKYYYVKRVQEYTLQSADFIGVFTSLTNIDAAFVYNGSLRNSATLTTNVQSILVDNKPFTTVYNDVATIGKYFIVGLGTQYLYFGVEKGTTLAEAQTALAGTKIWYQLATPIETEILALGNAQGLAGGTVYVDDIMADSNIYTSKYDIENTAYPIKSLDRIVKINADGSQTELEVSSATIAGDGLSFTHPSLVANDIVWIAYYYDVANLFKSNTFVTYYDNPFIAVQPNGTPRKIVFAVDDSGVVTVSSQAV